MLCLSPPPVGYICGNRMHCTNDSLYEGFYVTWQKNRTSIDTCVQLRYTISADFVMWGG